MSDEVKDGGVPHVRNNIFGNVSITWSEPMSLAELQDLRDFTALWLKGIDRRARATGGENE